MPVQIQEEESFLGKTSVLSVPDHPKIRLRFLLYRISIRHSFSKVLEDKLTSMIKSGRCARRRIALLHSRSISEVFYGFVSKSLETGRRNADRKDARAQDCYYSQSNNSREKYFSKPVQKYFQCRRPHRKASKSRSSGFRWGLFRRTSTFPRHRNADASRSGRQRFRRTSPEPVAQDPYNSRR